MTSCRYHKGAKPCKPRRGTEKVLPLAHGRVLEIGIGTGLNLAYYDKAKIQQIVGLDPALEMYRLARKRMKAAGLAIELVGLPAERIPFDAGAFDTVLVMYTLCSIAEPVAALKEMRRVLKPGGSLIFCEHGLPPDPSVRRWQDRLSPLWSKLGGGCHLNRDVPGLLRAAGPAHRRDANRTSRCAVHGRTRSPCPRSGASESPRCSNG